MKNKMKNKYQLLGYCGIFCGTDCDLYKAVHSGDKGAKAKVAKALSQELGIKIDASNLVCEGCQGSEKDMWFECRLCRIRQCGKRQGVKICTECQDYPCQVFKIRFSHSENAPKNLPRICEIGLDHWIENKLTEMCK